MLLLCVALWAQDAERPVRRVLADQTSAWNRGDIGAFMQGYEDAPETTFVGKEVTRGYRRVLDRYRVRYPTKEKMGTLAFSDLEVRPLGENHAVAIGRFHLKRRTADGGDADGIFTLVFRKTRNGWKIILDHTS